VIKTTHISALPNQDLLDWVGFDEIPGGVAMTINIVRVYKYCHGEGWKNCDRRMSGKGHCVLARYEAHQPSTLHM